MKADTTILAGLALLASFGMSLAQIPGLPTPGPTAESHLTDSVNFYEAENFESSLASAREALRMLNESSAIAYNNICSAHMGLGHYDQAIEACRKSLERSPGYARARNNLEWIYETQAEKNPTAGVYLNLSEVRYWQGALEESIAAARKALELDSENAIAYNNLCAAHAAGGNWPEAVTECEKALKIDPGYQLALNNLVWAQDRQVESP